METAIIVPDPPAEGKHPAEDHERFTSGLRVDHSAPVGVPVVHPFAVSSWEVFRYGESIKFWSNSGQEVGQ